jgi:hypothetical protein
VILWTGLVIPPTAQELQTQFAQSDRTVVWGIIGFGIILVLSIGGVGILLTHKVAGPLLQDLQLLRPHPRQPAGPGAREAAQGRRAAELLLCRSATCTRRPRPRRGRRARAGGRAAAIDATPEGKRAGLQRALDELRQLRKRKEDSLEAPPIDRMTTSGLAAVARWREGRGALRRGASARR